MWARWYGAFVEKIRTWAENDPDVRAVLIIGSQARTDVPADEWSDLDLLVFHADPARLIASTEWFQSFGTVVLSMVEPTALGGSRERRVLYSDGRDVDFAVFPAEAIRALTVSTEGQSVLSRGFVVLADKDHRLGGLESSAAVTPPASVGPSSRDEFMANFSDFYYHVLWAAKKLRRGETWSAKMVCDGYLKLLLVRMIEWSTLASARAKVDTWHDGRFVDRWAPPEVRDRLPSTFGRYQSQDLARALRETGRLYSQLGHQVAEKLGWSYPTEAEQTVWKLVDQTLKDMPITA